MGLCISSQHCSPYPAIFSCKSTLLLNRKEKFIYIYMCVCMCVYGLYIYIYICLCLYIYIYICTCPSLCNPMDYSLPSPSVHGIFQARILEWVVISFSRRSSWPRDRTCISYIGRWILYHCTTQKALYIYISVCVCVCVLYYYYYMYRALSLGAKFLYVHHKTLMLLDRQTGLEGNWKGIICILNIKENNLRYFVPIWNYRPNTAKT